MCYFYQKVTVKVNVVLYLAKRVSKMKGLGHIKACYTKGSVKRPLLMV
ncbi:protein of unknown function [Candidatus Nitrosocaldus cavascurensis]|uniref:Uncharacterized protein n=1 Tax=Candidatus Nitrosocaldus cavascurensis TaxID=2058097 RepID=A0A2K5AR09_9ARCH|nr:protein of unknown function [Candidatus Nitrosocaldus cavascurensis]